MRGIGVHVCESCGKVHDTIGAYQACCADPTPTTSAEREHVVSVIKESRGGNVRYRGRCSCGKQTHQHYATAEFAKTALRRTHIADVKGHTQ